MSEIAQLTRRLVERPAVPELDGVTVRNFAGGDDVETWLELRHRAFARERLGVRRWDAADFEREFLAKSWWNPEHMWLAEAKGMLASAPSPVGTVTLALRGSGDEAKPAVHWLAVLPRWRRRGIARLLLANLEAVCWDLGYRQVWLETHTAWSAAMRFYDRQGYRAADD